jgi:hypothetical protein
VKHRIVKRSIEWEDAFIVGIHRYSYRAGEPAKIIGVVMFTPNTDDPVPRPCYHSIFPDGVEEYTPVSDFLLYDIISEDDVERNNIPPVTQ